MPTSWDKADNNQWAVLITSTVPSSNLHTVVSASWVDGWALLTSTETIGLLGMGAQDGYLDFHTAPELWILSWGKQRTIIERFLPPPSHPSISTSSCQHPEMRQATISERFLPPPPCPCPRRSSGSHRLRWAHCGPSTDSRWGVGRTWWPGGNWRSGTAPRADTAHRTGRGTRWSVTSGWALSASCGWREWRGCRHGACRQ